MQEIGFISFILLLNLNSIFGYPDGAPERACFFMVPRHTHPHTRRPIFSQAGGAPYNITLDRTTFTPHKPLRVTISGAPFKGFLLIAAEEGSKDWPTGQFFSENNMARTMMCSARNDAITHGNDHWKDSITVLWYGPAFTTADMIQFVATVVTNRTTFWTGIKSVRVTQDASLAEYDYESQGENAPLFGAGTGMFPGMDPWGYPTTDAFGWGGGAGGRMGSGISAPIGGGRMGGAMGGMSGRMNGRMNGMGGSFGQTAEGGSRGGEGGSGGSGGEGGSRGSNQEGRSANNNFRSNNWRSNSWGGSGMSGGTWNPFSFLFGRRK